MLVKIIDWIERIERESHYFNAGKSCEKSCEKVLQAPHASGAKNIGENAVSSPKGWRKRPRKAT